MSIRRSAENGSFSEKVYEGSTFRPHSLGIDPLTRYMIRVFLLVKVFLNSSIFFLRLLFWSCESTNTINITRLDDDEPVGSISFGISDRPRLIAIYSEMR